ncbi:MAG: class I SAM-dependent methyltransferase [Limisphaerales bacterium]
MNLFQKAGRLGSRLLKIAATNPRRLSHVFGTALSASDDVVNPSCDLLQLPSVDVNDLLPAAGDLWEIRMLMFPKTHASISLLEFTALLLLLKRTKAKKVFEFGTFKGISITQLTLNLPPDSEVYTLDLPDEALNTAFATDPEDAAIAVEAGKGSLVPAELRTRIRFLKSDSAKFDETPFAGKMDFVFVDGAHNFEYVKNDSEKGWRMLRPGGIIAWHDCRHQDLGVVRYLLQSSYKPTPDRWHYCRFCFQALSFATIWSKFTPSRVI